jgi:hypothetical protein
MLTLGGERSKTCQQCSGLNEAYARFCIHCGGKVGIIPSSDCPSCGSSDTLNGPYCVRCGAATSLGKIKAPAGTGFSWGKKTQQDTIYNKLTVSFEKGISESSRGPTWLHTVAIVLGIICGATLAPEVIGNPTLVRFTSRLQWPSKGLIIYSNEPYASLKLESIKSNTPGEWQSFNGLLSGSGSIALSTIPAGNYLLTLKAPKKKSLVEPVTVSPDHPTVVGFPEKLKLPPQVDM